jgi:hypothetical protein
MGTFSSRQIALVGLLDSAEVLDISICVLPDVHAQGILSKRSYSIHVSEHTHIAYVQLMTAQGVVHSNSTGYQILQAFFRFAHFTKGLDMKSCSLSFPASGRMQHHCGFPHRVPNTHAQLQENITHRIQQSLSLPLISTTKDL